MATVMTPSRRPRWFPVAAWLCGVLPATVAVAAGAGERALAEYLVGRSTQVTYHAVRLSDGVVLASRDAKAPLLPASVQKLVTSAVALSVLGGDFQFTTSLAVLADDLLLVGDGDPILGDPVLAQRRGGSIYDTFDGWATRLAAAGVSAVKGNLIVDDGIFRAGRHADWPADQHHRWYCAPVAGLNFNDNCLDVQIRLAGGGPTVVVSPATRGIEVINRLRVGPRHLWGAVLSRQDSRVTINGTVSQSTAGPLSVAVNEPALLAGRVLAERITQAGIPLSGGIIRRPVVGPDRKLPPGAKLIAQHATPLATVLHRANKRSLNLAAECLLLRAAARVNGRATFANAQAVAANVLTAKRGLDAKQFTVADGSGLSRSNRLSAAAAVELLRQLAAGPHAKVFLASLAVAGTDGTLAKRLPALRGRVIGKTGTLNGVSTFAGYILGETGTPTVAFAVFCNRVQGGNWRARTIQDALVADWAPAIATP